MICVYRGDKADYVVQSVESILSQTVKSDDIVIVVDGPIGEKLNKAMGDVAKMSKTINVVRLPKNVGVGPASNEGIKYCKNELIAKMDADDVAFPDRLEKQLDAFGHDSKLTLLGGQLAEFEGEVENVVSYRKVPTSAKEIRKFARRRSPFNNQTVMYKKTAVLDVGGYPKLNRAEDYYLYSKLMAEKYKVGNLSDTLVYFRLDDNAMGRRKTWRHTKEIIKVRNEIRKLGISSMWDFVVTAAGQLAVFVLPSFFMKAVYGKLRK